LSSNDWKPHKINELGFVSRGKSRHRPRNAPELYGGPYPFVQTADIMNSEFYITTHSQTYSRRKYRISSIRSSRRFNLKLKFLAKRKPISALPAICCFPN